MHEVGTLQCVLRCRMSLCGMDANASLAAVRTGPRNIVERAMVRKAHRGVEVLPMEGEEDGATAQVPMSI